MPKVFEAPPGFVLHPDYLVPELRAQRDALLGALKFYASMMGRRKSDNEPFYMSALDLDCGDRARAAIKAVEGEKK